MEARARQLSCEVELEQALVLLEQAQGILDRKRVSADVGARLQELIELIKSLADVRGDSN